MFSIANKRVAVFPIDSEFMLKAFWLDFQHHTDELVLLSVNRGFWPSFVTLWDSAAAGVER